MHDVSAAWSLLLGEQTGGMGDFAPWAQLFATAVITGLFIWIITKRDPDERDRSFRELSAARNEYQASLTLVLKELAAERASREATAEKFSETITENRERSHEQRIEDRKVYQESTRSMLQEFLAAIRQIREDNR